MTKERFTSCFGLLQTHFGSMEPEKVAVYYDALSDMPDDLFYTATKTLIKTFHPTAACHFPVIADFIQAIGQDHETAAKFMLMNIIRSIRKVGAYRSVNFGPAANSVIDRFGGWPAVCYWTEEDWRINEGRFLAVLESALKYGIDGPDRVSGFIEQTNGEALSHQVADMSGGIKLIKE